MRPHHMEFGQSYQMKERNALTSLLKCINMALRGVRKRVKTQIVKQAAAARLIPAYLFGNGSRSLVLLLLVQYSHRIILFHAL